MSITGIVEAGKIVLPTDVNWPSGTVVRIEPLSNPTPSNASLPDWCNVYEGLSDKEIAEVEQFALLRADFTRFAESCNGIGAP